MRSLRSITLVACLLALAAASLAVAQTVARIDTVAGTGTAGFSGDGGGATGAQLATPSDVAFVGGTATYLIADTANNRIRRVNDTGTISTVAGAGPGNAPGAFAGDGLAATNPTVRLNGPRGVSPTPDGGFLIADTGNNRIRRVSATGVITTVAGSGRPGFGGDGDAATGATLNAPRDVAALPDGSFLVADTGNNRIRLVTTSGIIVTVAGGGETFGDRGPANAAALNAPSSVAPIIGGGYLIADTGDNVIRRVDATGTITTVAGTGTPGAGGDGGSPTAAQLNAPEGVAITGDGAVFIGDTGNQKVREIDTQGTISTLAGTGTPGFSGDGGPPATAQLANPRGVAAAGGAVWTADSANNRVRLISNVTTTPTPGVNQRPSQTAPIGISPPRIGVSIVAGTVAGTVLIRRPGESTFSPLIGGGNFPLGSELDTTHGTVQMWYETNEDGTQAGVYASQGRFITKQPQQRDQGQRPGELDLSGPIAKCPSAGSLPSTPGKVVPRTLSRGRSPGVRSQLFAQAVAARRKPHGRDARVRAKGKVKTRGRYGSAIVRGTGWTTHDFCRGSKSGTLFSVFEGVVSVRDFVRHKTVTVRAGRKYFA
jgi:NHL repeat-containing protein